MHSTTVLNNLLQLLLRSENDSVIGHHWDQKLHHKNWTWNLMQHKKECRKRRKRNLFSIFALEQTIYYISLSVNNINRIKILVTSRLVILNSNSQWWSYLLVYCKRIFHHTLCKTIESYHNKFTIYLTVYKTVES